MSLNLTDEKSTLAPVIGTKPLHVPKSMPLYGVTGHNENSLPYSSFCSNSRVLINFILFLITIASDYNQGIS